MKKLMSVFLTAVILIMSVFYVNAFAQEQTKTEKLLQSSNPEYVFSVVSKSGNSEYTARIYVKDNKTAAVAHIPISDSRTLDLKVVVSDRYMYMFLPDFPIIHLRIETKDFLLLLPAYDDLIFVKSYEQNEGSVTYYVKEYTGKHSGEVVKFYYFEENLQKIETDSTDEYGNPVYTCFKIISNKVDDSIFDIPWYSINVFPFVRILEMLQILSF